MERRTRRTTLIGLSVLATGILFAAGSSALADTGGEPTTKLRVVVDENAPSQEGNGSSGREDCPDKDRAPSSTTPEGSEGL